MALTIAVPPNADSVPVNGGALKVLPVKITFDSSYPTGGESVTAASFGMNRIIAIVGGSIGSAVSRICTFDPVNSKLILATAIGTEAADTSDQSAIVVYATVIGV